MVQESGLVLLAEQIVSYIAVYYILTVSLNKKAGMTGIPDFGVAMFFAVGGIVVGNLATRIGAAIVAPSLGMTRGEAWHEVIANNTAFVTDLNTQVFPNHALLSIGLILISLVLGLILGGLLGWLASYPALRLRGDYLAIMLLAASEGLRNFVKYTPSIMGSTPTVGLTAPNLLGFTGNRGLWGTVITVLLAVLVYIYAERFYHSPSGRLFRAVRDDEESAEAIGKDVAKVRRDSMIIGSALAALAGVAYSLNIWMAGSSLAAQKIFDRVLWTFWPWALMILGGMSSNRGVAVSSVIVGAIIIGPIRIYKNEIAKLIPVQSVGIDPAYFANALEFFFIGGLIIAVLFLRPQGIIPEPPSRPISKKKLREIIRKYTP